MQQPLLSLRNPWKQGQSPVIMETSKSINLISHYKQGTRTLSINLSNVIREVPEQAQEEHHELCLG